MLPMALGMIAMFSYNIADTYFVGQLGTLELAALSFTFPVGFIVGAVTMGFGIGTSSVCARLFGAKQLEDVERVAVHAILLGLMVGAAVVVLGLSTIDPVFRLLGADDTTMPIIRRYISIYYWGGIFLVVPMITNSVLRASGKREDTRANHDHRGGHEYRPRPDSDIRVVRRATARGGGRGDRHRSRQRRHDGRIDSGHGLQGTPGDVPARVPSLIMDSWRRILHVGLPSMASSLIAR